MIKRNTSIAVTLLLLVVHYLPIYAQDTVEEGIVSEHPDNWGFTITPYAWLAGQATDVGGEKLRQSFNDLSSLTNFGFQLATKVRYKKWQLTIDGTYANLATRLDEGVLKINLDIKQYIIDSKLGYSIYSSIDYSKTEEIIRGWSLVGTLGVKYWRNDINVDYTIQIGNLLPIEGGISEPQAWTDLMIGLKSKIVLNKRVLLGIAANGGGFGMGNSSNFSWDFTFSNTFKINKLIYITAGYRTFRYKRVDGEGSSQLETTVSVFGPLLGVSFML